MARLVLTDASPLIGFARVEGVAWLGALFGEVWMPDEVRREVLSGLGVGDEQAIGAAEAAGILRVWPSAAPDMLPHLGGCDRNDTSPGG